MSTIKVNEIQNTAGSSLLTSSGTSASGPVMGQFGFKNRIINGAMMIDQRNDGASVSIAGSAPYTVDRFTAGISQGSGHTAQRSTVAPAGFVNSLQITVGTGASPVAGSVSRIYQPIEGFSVADLGWGTASAQTVTLSFWVRSSLTGTFAGALYNGAGNRTYIFTYTVNSANTWEYETITIPGDTTGTWATNNTVGIYANWDLGSGSTFQGTAGSWTASGAWATSGSVKLAATSGATFYITGVQLEKGSVATPFDFRSIGQELALCQRYYERPHFGAIAASRWTTLDWTGNIRFAVTKRATPTISISGSLDVYANGNNGTTSNLSVWASNIGQQLDGFGLRGIGGSNQDVAGAIFSQNTAVIQVSSEL